MTGVRRMSEMKGFWKGRINMTSKERVMAALKHQEADRIPLDIGCINNTCMHELVEKDVKQHLHLADHGYEVKARSQGIVVPDRSITDYFGVDTCSIYINEAAPWKDNGDGTFTDMWGIGMKLNPDGYYYNRINHPLEHIEDASEVESYQLPDPTPYMLEGLSARLDANADKCCVLEGLEEPMFGMPSWLRRNDNFYMDLIAEPEICEAIQDKLMVFYKKLIKYIMDPLGDRIDIVKIADDLGAQSALLISPEIYRERIKPYQAELIRFIKDTYHKPVLMHSCGAIKPIIGDLIDIGVDALNPVQISAAGMAPRDLKREFGDHITFWGGGIDTQSVLYSATPDEVRKSVEENIGAFKPGGGYVFAQVHNILPGTPVENILAMYETYKKFSEY